MPRSRLFLLWCSALLAVAMLSVPARAAEPATDVTTQTITALLDEFLARVDDPAMHERFWADDLVYTSGQGVVRTKAEIVRSVAGALHDPAAAKTTYGAEDVRVRIYGEFAALTFRLVIRNPDGTTWYSRNSGAFLRRDGLWQVVTWQATREPAATP